ncbi:hypothetical protein HaLaN_03408 [Haematococcus lacustris]|uniref:Uncharacterized protein n=1 Tax=Haematococcus lacustris TaxID=44745 RepID=A0A699YNS2_HAELA|nr:hypothetical protein HaLaN_03408 [Haematococcus lacustris]
MQPLRLVNSTLSLPASTLKYMAYWGPRYHSLFPDVATSAQWFGLDPSCQPPIIREVPNTQ